MDHPIAGNPYATGNMSKHIPGRAAHQNSTKTTARCFTHNEDVTVVILGVLYQSLAKVFILDQVCFCVDTGLT
jgi:hypothetical protein